MIRIGLIGAGRMAGVYADRISDIDGCRVAAVASPSSAEAFVETEGLDAASHATAAEMCEQVPLDAVAILTPTDTHAEFVDLAAARGLDVICEKPIARTLAGAHEIRDVVRETGISCMIAHVVRFFPEYRTIQEQVDDGEIGTPGVARARRAFGYAGDRGWFDDHERSGGVLLDLAIHDFDYLRWTLGPVNRVFTRRTDWVGTGHSEATLTVLRFANGAIGHVESWAVEVPAAPFERGVEIAGPDGILAYDLDEVQPLTVHHGEETHVPSDALAGERLVGTDAYTRQLVAFIDAIENDRAPPVGVDEGIASLRVSLAAIESHRVGEPVAPGSVTA